MTHYQLSYQAPGSKDIVNIFKRTAGPELDRSVLVNIKAEQHSGVNVLSIIKCFPKGGGDSILNIFSWEPSQAIIVLGALVIWSARMCMLCVHAQGVKIINGHTHNTAAALICADRVDAGWESEASSLPVATIYYYNNIIVPLCTHIELEISLSVWIKHIPCTWIWFKTCRPIIGGRSRGTRDTCFPNQPEVGIVAPPCAIDTTLYKIIHNCCLILSQSKTLVTLLSKHGMMKDSN